MNKLYKIYGNKSCDQCSQAVALLQSKGKNFEYIDLMLEENSTHLQRMKDMGAKSVPQIFMSDKGEEGSPSVGEALIGGFTELKSYLEQQEL